MKSKDKGNKTEYLEKKFIFLILKAAELSFLGKQNIERCIDIDI